MRDRWGNEEAVKSQWRTRQGPTPDGEEANLPDAPKSAPSLKSSPRGDETEVVRLTRELKEALEQQNATSEVLQVISGSPSDLEPVFSTMLEKAVRICGASFGNIYRWDGEALNIVASYNTAAAFAEQRRKEPVSPASDKSGRADDREQEDRSRPQHG